MTPSSYDVLRPDLPDEISELFQLALDLRWSWNHVADDLWRYIDPDLWTLTQNPWLILQTVSRARLRDLARDDTFLSLLKTLRQEQLRALSSPGWLEQKKKDTALPRVAYFSMEYGISEALPIYSGGLGVLAGDHLKSSGEAGLGLTAIGLLYQQGYFRQGLDEKGRQLAFYPYNDPTQLPVVPARDDEGEWIHVNIELPGRLLQLRLWQAQIGRIRLILLDSNSPLNLPADRGITAELYGGGSQMRLQQEMVLGIGGVRALAALDISFDVLHLNEGHSAFAVLERARRFKDDRHCDFATALTATRGGNLFTTHTPVDAGFDRFPPHLLCQHLRAWATKSGIDCTELVALGQWPVPNGDSNFNMAILATRGSAHINAVSRLHRRVSQQLFSNLYPRWPLPEIPIGYVTNGVHMPTWDSAESDRLWTQHCGKDRWQSPRDDLRKIIRGIDDHELWTLRGQNRVRLIEWIRDRYRRQPTLVYTGSPNGSLKDDQLLDPNVLTVGFARRFATYKRLNLLLHDREHLAKLLHDAQRPLQLVIGGKAHPLDASGQTMIAEWTRFIRDFDLQGKIIFLVDYDLTVARHLVQGVDLWLNTPRRPWEASGTSGMKVLVNGGINFSALDGWWNEAWTPEVGYALGDGQEHDEPYDTIEAKELFDKLEQQVIPDFFERDHNGIPQRWVQRIRESMAKLTPKFSTNRMVAEYFHNHYVPLAERYRRRSTNDAALAKDIVAWQQRIERHWNAIHVGNIETRVENTQIDVSAQVFLDGLEDSEVRVQFYADPPEDDADPIIQTLQREEPLPGTINGYRYHLRFESNRPLSDYTLRIIPYHPEAVLPVENTRILWAR